MSAVAGAGAASSVVCIDGIAFWSPALPGWTQARQASSGRPHPVDAASDAASDATALSPRPAPSLLAANERRRAPASVLLALQVAQDAVAESGHEARDLVSIFTSAYGDLPIVDALCRTLATDPLLLSPTRFHHSVHNAASGYWAIASGSQAASTAIAAGAHSFAAGLLEAATTVVTDDSAVLLVGFDTEACGPLASVNSSRGWLGVALVLAPVRGPRSRWHLSLALAADAAASADHMPSGQSATPDGNPRGSAAWQSLQHNAQADALPLFEALAREGPQHLTMALGAGLALQLHLQPIADSDADPAASQAG